MVKNDHIHKLSIRKLVMVQKNSFSGLHDKPITGSYLFVQPIMLRKYVVFALFKTIKDK